MQHHFVTSWKDRAMLEAAFDIMAQSLEWNLEAVTRVQLVAFLLVLPHHAALENDIASILRDYPELGFTANKGCATFIAAKGSIVVDTKNRTVTLNHSAAEAVRRAKGELHYRDQLCQRIP